VTHSFSILAISGSLRTRSSNTEALRAAAMLAPLTVSVKIFDGLGALPHFNPDLDVEGAIPPPTVRKLREQIGAADALLICSPEYAHGVPGSLKNALDWLVSAPEMVCKPIGLLNISPRSTHAHASLAETLRTMSTVIVPGATVELPLSGTGLDAAGIAAVPAFAKTLRASIDSLVDAVEHRRAVGEAVFCL
jgi:NAD(P)H-dependent FMN reductase